MLNKLSLSRGSSRPASPDDDGVEQGNSTAAAPSQVLTGIIDRLPDVISREVVDQIAIEFAFINSKAARKRLIKVSINSSPRSIEDDNSFSFWPQYQRIDWI